MAPLQPLAQAGYFNDPSSRLLVITDGLYECSDPKVQLNILEVLANSQERRLPLVFLVASRPEQHISLMFNTGFLLKITSILALDELYLHDEDIKLFLTDLFQEIPNGLKDEPRNSLHYFQQKFPRQFRNDVRLCGHLKNPVTPVGFLVLECLLDGPGLDSIFFFIIGQ